MISVSPIFARGAGADDPAPASNSASGDTLPRLPLALFIQIASRRKGA